MKNVVLLIIVSITILFIMHYTIMTDYSECNQYTFIYNFINTLFDAIIILSPFILLSKYSKCYLLIPLFIITFISIAHIVYGYYFNSYIPYILFTEFNNLTGLSNNIYYALSSPSILFITFIVLVSIIYIILSSASSIRTVTLFKAFSIILCALICSNILVTVIEWKGEKHIIKFKTKNKYTIYRDTNYAKSMFELGLIQNYICDILKQIKHDKPNINDIRTIDNFIDSTKPTKLSSSAKNYNLIFIIVESLNSEPIYKRIGNIEITPHLNKYANIGYYNPNMKPEISKGESSDGQFIYLTGLMPMKEGVTIIDYFNNSFISFIHQIKKQYPNYTSRMIIPTSETFWRQSEMCVKYGIDSLYSHKNYINTNSIWLNDQEIFTLAMDKDNNSKQPFISIILTSSTHSPYDTSIHKSNIDYLQSYPYKYQNYLDAVQYTDLQIGNYLDYLQQKEWYEKTLVFIVSDHNVHNNLLDMNNSTLSTDLPLIILNSPSSICRAPKETIYQSDIYPTILDIMNIDSKWRGVGNSLYTNDTIYDISIKEEISLKILRNNYFRE